MREVTNRMNNTNKYTNDVHAVKCKIDTNNISVNPETRSVAIRINPKIYKLHVIMNAVDDFLEKSEFIIDGDPEKEIIVKFILKRRYMEKRMKKCMAERNIDEGELSEDELLKIVEEELLDMAHRFSTLIVTYSSTR